MEASGEVALEAAQRALLGLAFGPLARQVGLRGRVVAGAGDGDDVQRVVELAVAAAVEPVPVALTRGARDRRGAGLADTFEDLPGKWQAAILTAEQNPPKLRVVSGT